MAGPGLDRRDEVEAREERRQNSWVERPKVSVAVVATAAGRADDVRSSPDFTVGDRDDDVAIGDPPQFFTRLFVDRGRKVLEDFAAHDGVEPAVPRWNGVDRCLYAGGRGDAIEAGPAALCGHDP